MIVEQFINLENLNLKRYPTEHRKELRAWNAADAYLLNQCLLGEPVVIVNDEFGALHCTLEQYPHASVYHINDSWCAQAAISVNKKILPYTPYSTQSVSFGLVKLPKSLSLLNYQLKTLAATLTKPLPLYFSGMQKHVSNGHLAVIRDCGVDLVHQPTLRKARLYTGMLPPSKHAPSIYTLKVPELNLILQNNPGVFSEKKLDMGSLFFIEHFSLLPRAKRVADVGCGNGLLALAYHKHHSESQLFLFDESTAAIESAKASFQMNSPNANYHITHHDGLRDITLKFDLILINPPFHQNNTVTTDIALNMFKQARHCLSNNGQLWIVANRHLDYEFLLKRWFTEVRVVRKNQKFMIIKATCY